MIDSLRRVLTDEEGGALVEFALVLGLVSVVTVAALTAFVQLLIGLYEATSSGYTNIGVTAP